MSKLIGSNKVKFTLASVNDKQMTVTASRLGVNPKRKGQTFVRTFKTGNFSKVQIKFRVNRLSSHSVTLMSIGYNGKLPKVGQPIFLAKV